MAAFAKGLNVQVVSNFVAKVMVVFCCHVRARADLLRDVAIQQDCAAWQGFRPRQLPAFNVPPDYIARSRAVGMAVSVGTSLLRAIQPPMLFEPIRLNMGAFLECPVVLAIFWCLPNVLGLGVATFLAIGCKAIGGTSRHAKCREFFCSFARGTKFERADSLAHVILIVRRLESNRPACSFRSCLRSRSV